MKTSLKLNIAAFKLFIDFIFIISLLFISLSTIFQIITIKIPEDKCTQIKQMVTFEKSSIHQGLSLSYQATGSQ